MADEVPVSGEGRGDLGGCDPEGFAGRFRHFAVEADRILRRPDSPVDEVFELHRRMWSLLQESPEASSGGMRRWLLGARQAIADRLQRWAAEELGGPGGVRSGRRG